MNPKIQKPKYFKVLIVRASLSLCGNSINLPSYKNKIGKKIFVKKSNQPLYCDAKAGYSVLITDCVPVR
jgi:hypothetical protein